MSHIKFNALAGEHTFINAQWGDRIKPNDAQSGAKHLTKNNTSSKLFDF